MTRLDRIRHEITQERLDLTEFARLLRQDAMGAEALMWACLRNRRMNRRKFRRQHPVMPYVLDFYCAELRLGIELDGGQHNRDTGRKRDAARTAFLRNKGIRTLRFTNREVLVETDSVLNAIWKATAHDDAVAPSP